jgi:putative peptidoglycan lipid II flippase
MIAAGILMNSTTVIDQTMAAMLAPGSVAVLGYGNKLVNLIVGVTTTAIGTSVLPYLSKMIAADDWVGLRHTLRTYSKLIMVTTIPLTIVLCLLSTNIVRLLFQRGAFTAADTHTVALVQAMYLLQVPFFTLSILFVRAISSLRANTILTWGTIVSFIVNITLDYFLMRMMGAAGIALATTGVYMISLCFLFAMWHRLTRDR